MKRVRLNVKVTQEAMDALHLTEAVLTIHSNLENFDAFEDEHRQDIEQSAIKGMRTAGLVVPNHLKERVWVSPYHILGIIFTVVED